MEEVEGNRRRRDRQSISVPFLWEEKPGTPKKEWVSKGPFPFFAVPSPARLIVSVPFQWEQAPGKPLDQLPQPWHEQSSITLPPEPLSLLPLLAYSPNLSPVRNFCSQARATNPFIDDESWRSGLGPSLLPACPLAGGIPCAAQVDQTSTRAEAYEDGLSEDNSNQPEHWYSVSETDSYSSSKSTATRNTSLDSSAMEFLFPLPFPGAGFLNKGPAKESTFQTTSEELLAQDHWNRYPSLQVKRNFTLGELILLSRKLSYRMKPMDSKKTTLPMDFIKKKFFACFSFDTNGSKSKALISYN